MDIEEDLSGRRLLGMVVQTTIFPERFRKKLCRKNYFQWKKAEEYGEEYSWKGDHEDQGIKVQNYKLIPIWLLNAFF